MTETWQSEFKISWLLFCQRLTVTNMLTIMGSVAGLEIKKNVWLQFATSYENSVATLKILVVKLIEAI